MRTVMDSKSVTLERKERWPVWRRWPDYAFKFEQESTTFLGEQ
jgi:hypothetical protein